MQKWSSLALLLALAYPCYAQPTYSQLKAYEGVYEYANQSTLKIAASPRDTLLYAIINESKYPLRPTEKDVFLNASKDKVLFLRNASSAITGYTVGKDTFNLISTKVTFPKEMWYPKMGTDKTYKYAYKQPKNRKDGLKTGGLEHTGLDKNLLNNMMQEIVKGSYPNVHSILIIKDGKLVFEEYFYEHDRNKLHELRSATKSFVSALTGIAIEKKYIKSKNEPVLNFFPEYVIQQDVAAKRKITIENLLTNQSGLDCDVSDSKSVGNETTMNNSDDWVKFTLDLPMVDSAGGKGRYCSGNPITLCSIIEKATQQPLADFAQQNLFGPLGIKNYVWNFKPDKSSVETFCQLYLNSRDMAKFGLMYLNNGNWNGTQVVPTEWVEQSFAKHSVVQGLDYGYLWWSKYFDVEGVRYYAKGAQGNGGQKIYIWEAQNMVTVITGGNYNTQSPSDELLKKYILPAFNKK